MSKNRTYVSPAVMGAQYGFGFIPIDHSAFKKSQSERKGIKRMKKRATNKGKPRTVVIFTCNKTEHGTFGGKTTRKNINSRSE